MSQKPHPTDNHKSAVGKDKKNQHITKITAKPSSNANPAPTKQPAAQPQPTQNPKTLPDKKPKKAKGKTSEKPLKQVFILFRPFVAFGRYTRDSWREIRQVRWPNRKVTWKMTLAVLVYCAIFMVLILLLDTLFTFLFNSIIQK